MRALPPVLSIKQPWAWLITHSTKDIENRKWRTSHRGPFLIHAPAKLDTAATDALRVLRMCVPLSGPAPTGGIVGWAELTDCVTESPSPWFSGPFGFVLRQTRAVPFVPMLGRLGFWRVREADEEPVREALRSGGLAGF